MIYIIYNNDQNYKACRIHLIGWKIFIRLVHLLLRLALDEIIDQIFLLVAIHKVLAILA